MSYSNFRIENPFQSFSEAERAYAILQLDPFHDYEYKVTGAPSDQNSNSSILVLNQEFMLDAATFGLAATEGGKMDFHVAMLPLLRSSNSYPGAMTDVSAVTCGGTAGVESPFTNLFPITVSGVSTGDPTFVKNVTTTPAADFVGLDNSLVFYTSSTTTPIPFPRLLRVIGNSFEVVDETPKMYAQGSVCVYQRPSMATDSRTAVRYNRPGDGVLNSVSFVNNTFSGPPNRLDQATILPNSKTWKASQGCYVVQRLASLSNPFKRPGLSSFCMLNAVDPQAGTAQNCFVSREGLNNANSPGTTSYYDAVNAVTPYNISGAYFSGVSTQYGAFRLRSRIVIEVIPDPADTTLIAQATPTLPRNPTFERMLNTILAQLPVGTPQTNNPSGEWWRQVINTSSDVLMALAPVVSPFEPQAGALMSAAGAYGKKASRKKPKPKVVSTPKRPTAAPKTQSRKGK